MSDAPCTACKPAAPAHPDHGAELKRLNRIIGQLEGVKRMIEQRAYCPDILVQTRAAGAALRSLEAEILRGHLAHCLKEALTGGDAALAQGRINEVVELFRRDG